MAETVVADKVGVPNIEETDLFSPGGARTFAVEG